MTVLSSSNSAVLDRNIDVAMDSLFFAQKDLSLDHKTIMSLWYVAQWQ